MRLIDADKLMQDLADEMLAKALDMLNYDNVEYMIDRLASTPTAYDVDKVVKHIEECNRIREKDMKKKIDRELRIYYEGQLFIANEIIKLIKRGGIND